MYLYSVSSALFINKYGIQKENSRQDKSVYPFIENGGRTIVKTNKPALPSLRIICPENMQRGHNGKG